jgi:hypothetical protein
VGFGLLGWIDWHTRPVTEELPSTAWDPEPGSAAGTGVIYGAAFTVGVLLLPDPISGWWNLAVLVPGWLVVGVVAWLLYAPAKYTLTASAIERSCRGHNESIPLGDLTEVYGYYRPQAGDFIVVNSRDRCFDLKLGGQDVDQLLERIGPLLVVLGTDRKVIADEKTRRWLGLPGGGLRDPWTPKG